MTRSPIELSVDTGQLNTTFDPNLFLQAMFTSGLKESQWTEEQGKTVQVQFFKFFNLVQKNVFNKPPSANLPPHIPPTTFLYFECYNILITEWIEGNLCLNGCLAGIWGCLGCLEIFGQDWSHNVQLFC